MALYRKNLQLAHEFFTIISCFEIALRNAIDNHYLNILGSDWLYYATTSGGMFNNRNCKVAADTIRDAKKKLGSQYTHDKLVAELGFGAVALRP